MKEDNMRYGFGANWAGFIEKEFNEERLESAKSHLLEFIKLNDLHGRSFVDIGCGSGLHSLAAFRARAEKIYSLDYDEESVKTTQYLHQHAGNPDNWKIEQGSALDEAFLGTLGKYDIVYSWGVLHHTGDMWQAMKNVIRLMKDDGILYISLYTSDVFNRPSPEFWLKLKQRYNRSGTTVKIFMDIIYALVFAPRGLLTYLKNKLKNNKKEDRNRGMSFWPDIRDWLGGWPMEFAAIKEVKDFYIHQHNLELLNINAGEATTEYLFRKKGSRNYWNDYLSRLNFKDLDRPYESCGGNAWLARINIKRGGARLMLYEDGIPIGFHASHKHIRSLGNGRYAQEGDSLMFSTTDNTNPNTNGRNYTYTM